MSVYMHESHIMSGSPCVKMRHLFIYFMPVPTFVSECVRRKSPCTDSGASNVNPINDTSGDAEAGRAAKVTQICLENVEQQTIQQSPDEFPVFLVLENPPR